MIRIRIKCRSRIFAGPYVIRRPWLKLWNCCRGDGDERWQTWYLHGINYHRRELYNLWIESRWRRWRLTTLLSAHNGLGGETTPWFCPTPTAFVRPSLCAQVHACRVDVVRCRFTRYTQSTRALKKTKQLHGITGDRLLKRYLLT